MPDEWEGDHCNTTENASPFVCTRQGVCTSGFSRSAPPPTTMLPVIPSFFKTQRDTPTRRRAQFYRVLRQNPDAGAFPSLFSEAPGVWADTALEGAAPAGQPLAPHP